MPRISSKVWFVNVFKIFTWLPLKITLVCSRAYKYELFVALESAECWAFGTLPKFALENEIIGKIGYVVEFLREFQKNSIRLAPSNYSG